MVLMWVEITNKYFGAPSDVIWQLFSRVTKSPVKIIRKSHHEWANKILMTVTNVLFYFLHAFLCHEHTVPLKQ